MDSMALRVEGRRTVSSNVLILNDLSHLTFVTVVIVIQRLNSWTVHFIFKRKILPKIMYY